MIPRYGDNVLHELPRRCLIAPPVMAGEWYHYLWSERTSYEVLVGELLGMGTPAPGHPAACTTPGCGHAIVWHAQKTRDHACRIEGCACMKLVRFDITPLAQAVKAAMLARATS